jgi:CheY-like chemotaxis protein/energy-coupling factor transporter ATP-binding protein EcfA2
MNILNIFSKPKKIAVPEERAATPAYVANLVVPEGGWKPMGYILEGSYVVLSLKTGQLVTLRANDLNIPKLQVWLGRDACKASTVYDTELQKEVEEGRVVIDAIAEDCDRLGLFDFKAVRGPGLYREGDDLVVNFGQQVVSLSGKPVSLERQKKQPVYQSGPDLGFSLDTPCASESEVQSVLSVLGSFGWSRVGDWMMLVGWFVAAFFGTALPHRPILSLTAERGSGKTTLIEFLGRLLGSQAIRRDGMPTVAQTIYALEHSQATLIVDEFEARSTKKSAVDEFFKLLREGFSFSDADRIMRVIGGQARYFNVPAGALLAGISMPTFDSATATRAFELVLHPLPEASRAGYEPLLDLSRGAEVTAVGERVRRLLLDRWGVMRAALDGARLQLISLGHEARIADKFAPIVAGYVALTHKGKASPEELRAVIAEMGLEVPRHVSVERDAETCVNVLLSRKVVVFRMVNGVKEKLYMTIRDVLTILVHDQDNEHREQLSKQLEEFGVRALWVRSSASWKLAVCTSSQHEGVRRLMMRTDWAHGGWKDVLMRLPGAEASVQKVARVSQRVVTIDMPRSVLVPEGDDYDFPEPMAA